jgi:hypothetical protein
MFESGLDRLRRLDDRLRHVTAEGARLFDGRPLLSVGGTGPGSWLGLFCLVVPYRVATPLAAVLAFHIAALTPLVARYFSHSPNAELVQPSPELVGAAPIGLPP